MHQVVLVEVPRLTDLQRKWGFEDKFEINLLISQ